MEASSGEEALRAVASEISITPTEYDILRQLRVNISNLRHKIEPDPSQPRYIRTEAGVGYRLQPES